MVVVFVCGGKFPLFPGESNTSKPLCGYEQNGSITHFTLITMKVKTVLTPIKFLQKNDANNPVRSVNITRWFTLLGDSYGESSFCF